MPVTAVKIDQQDVLEVKPSDGDVHVYREGKRTVYHGRRTAASLVSFVLQVNSSEVKVISGKLDKIAFDSINQPKVVGFFMKGTPDFQAFQEAAGAFLPSVPFYVTFDRTVAKHLKLDTVGQIHIVRPFERQPVSCPHNPATTTEIEAFVRKNKGSILTKLNEHNLYDPELIDPTNKLVLAIGEEASPLGHYLYHLLTKVIKNNTNNTEFRNLNIVWIEPQVFPVVYVVMDQLQSAFGVPPQLPKIGAVNFTNNLTAWFNTTLFNTTADKTADEQNLLLLQDWLYQVINDTLAPQPSGLQTFKKIPQSQIVPEGTDVVLECVIANPIGDCLWMKDGHNIGFNLNRFPQYSWVGERLNGDCSLKITGVTKGRDDGEWVCEVTGDVENPTITSTPAVISITGSEKMEL
ncbi:calsequestrin-1-like [Limulus polyphemus]|uniref:Calsequestrin n=1 Tax=Limulus polyphemus TaxID=6850 RepID=A0ABM1RY39_LIMPO|nr:calsequestrin-1-like [Limulus polyphemus]